MVVTAVKVVKEVKTGVHGDCRFDEAAEDE